MRVWPRRLILGGAALTFLVLGAGTGIYGFTTQTLQRKFRVPLDPIAVPADSQSLARGRHIAVAWAKCEQCHGAGLEGRVMINSPAFGRLTAPNLTRGRGGVGGWYTDAQLARAIRHGIKADDTPVLFMPAQEFNAFSDEDVGALIAYVRSVPAVDNMLPESKVGLLPRLLYLSRQLDLVPAELIDHDARNAVVPAGVTREYGEYIAKTAGCFGCHGTTLTGGRLPGAPPSHPPPTNITPAAIGSWSEADFMRAMRTGVRPDGRSIDPFMPWRAIGQLTADELRALWLYLRSVPPMAKR